MISVSVLHQNRRARRRLRGSDGHLVLHLADNIVELNTIGRRVWQHMDGVQSVEDVSEVISKEFGAPIDVVREDVHTLAQELISEGFLLAIDATPLGQLR